MLPIFDYGRQIIIRTSKNKVYRKCQQIDPAFDSQGHKTTFDTLQNTSECHEVPHLPRETKQRDVWNLQKAPLLQNLP